MTLLTDHEIEALLHASREYGIALGDPKAEEFLRGTLAYSCHLSALYRQDLAEEIGGTVLRSAERLQSLIGAVRRIARRGSRDRADGTWERSRKVGLYRRLRLRRADGRIYLDRWGIGHDRLGRVLLHRMSAPDPGIDLHDHPWWFVTIPLWGGYTEQRADIRQAAFLATLADRHPTCTRGVELERRPFRPAVMRLDECHTIIELRRNTCWTLVIGGPRRRRWGFYLADGYMHEAEYDATVRAERRDLWSGQNIAARPWAQPDLREGAQP